MAKRLKIYAILTTINELVPSSGDKINEINLFKAMSTFADVYYNNQLFKPNKPGFGIKAAPIVVSDEVKYDFCYIRNNRKVFNHYIHRKLTDPKMHAPKLLWVASPYKESIFKGADGVVTYTEAWGRQLRTLGKHNITGLYDPKNTYIPKNILVFPQAVDFDEFFPKKGDDKTEIFRKKFGGDFVIAHFGRIATGNYPHSLMHILPKICDKYPNKKIKFIYSGLPSQIKLDIKNPNCEVMTGVPYENMSYALSACDLVSSNYRAGTANWGGSRHVLESIACGVPVLTGDFTVREEQLGKDYKLFWEWIPNKGRISNLAEEQMFNHICSLIENPKLGPSIAAETRKRIEKYSYKNVGIQIEKELRNLK